jgi:ABC-type multidrug transport system permease subunit
VIDETYRVAWGDLRFFRMNALQILLSCLVGPMLYIAAFGYGLGSAMEQGTDEYLRFLIPGIVSMATLSTTFSFIASKVFIQRVYHGSFDELVLCPIRYSSIVLGKAVIGLVRGMLSCAIIMIVGLLVVGDLLLSPFLILLIFTSTLTFSFLGVIAGMLAKKHNTLSVFSSLVITPMTFFSGTIFSIHDVPQTIAYAIYALPLTHPTLSIRATMLGTEIPWLSVIVLFAYCVIFYLAAYYLVRRRR